MAWNLKPCAPQPKNTDSGYRWIKVTAAMAWRENMGCFVFFLQNDNSWSSLSEVSLLGDSLNKSWKTSKSMCHTPQFLSHFFSLSLIHSKRLWNLSFFPKSHGSNGAFRQNQGNQPLIPGRLRCVWWPWDFDQQNPKGPQHRWWTTRLAHPRALLVFGPTKRWGSNTQVVPQSRNINI